MAKTNMLMREKRRLKVAKKYAAKRAQLKELIRDPKTGAEERAQAQAKLGAKFDIKAFHDAGLLSGAVPLDVLDRVMST